jgi:hypothetical protein
MIKEIRCEEAGPGDVRGFRGPCESCWGVVVQAEHVNPAVADLYARPASQQKMASIPQPFCQEF